MSKVHYDFIYIKLHFCSMIHIVIMGFNRFHTFLSFSLISVFSRFLVYKRLCFRLLEEVWDSQTFQLWGFAVRESEESEELSGEPPAWSSWFRDCFIEWRSHLVLAFLLYLFYTKWEFAGSSNITFPFCNKPYYEIFR